MQTLQQAALDYGENYPNAQLHINQSFYVDDLLGGADSVQDAITLYSQITEIPTKGGFTLRKFRSSSNEVLSIIPKELVEPMPSKEGIGGLPFHYISQGTGCGLEFSQGHYVHRCEPNQQVCPYQEGHFCRLSARHSTCWDGSHQPSFL